MKRVRRFLEVLAACALAGVSACWLANYHTNPHSEVGVAARSPHSLETASVPRNLGGKKAESDASSLITSESDRLPTGREATDHRATRNRNPSQEGNLVSTGISAIDQRTHRLESGPADVLDPLDQSRQLSEHCDQNPVSGDSNGQSQQVVIPVSYESQQEDTKVEISNPIRLGDEPREKNAQPEDVMILTYQGERSDAGSAQELPNLSNPLYVDQRATDQRSPNQVLPVTQAAQGSISFGSQQQSPRETIATPRPDAAGLTITSGRPEIVVDDTGLQLELRDADIRDALHAMAKLAKLNVVLSSSVQGKVTVSLNGLSPRDAIFAVLRVPGFVSQEYGGVIYVGTEQEIQNLGYVTDQLATRIYRPNYTPAKELESLIKPLLTPQIGLITISTAAESGIAPDATNAGGDKYAGTDILIVRDYERVLQEVDRIVREIDVRPAQVAIEAMILSVNLDDEDQFGVSFELLRNEGHIKFGWGLVPKSLNDIKFDNTGMKLAFLDGSIGAFVNALESIGDTNVIATPRLLVLNKHRAEILIGKELGYVSTTFTETSSSQTVDFLKVGAQLVIRPFISNDGLIRMEVHPELSTGSVQITNNFTVPNKDTTQVTTNIMVPNGVTVVIGGLMREDLETSASQIPFLGNLPLVGAAFRNKTETTKKQEIIVLITPYIVDDYRIAADGAASRSAWERRQEVAGEEMSGWNKQNAAKHFLEKAKMAYAQGRCQAARQWAEMAVNFDPSNFEAIAFRDQISGVVPSGTGSAFPSAGQ